MKVFITKLALTKGIVELEAKPCIDVSEYMIETRSNGYSVYYHKKDWYLTKEEAIKKANKMRDRKIVSLKKQIEKLEKLNFE